MIGDAPLREVVGADAFGAIAAADLQFARLRLRTLLPLLFRGKQPRSEQRHGARAVLVLRAFVLTLDHDAAWQMRDAYGGVRLVHVLPARTRGAIGVDAELSGIYHDLLDLIELGEDSHR